MTDYFTDDIVVSIIIPFFNNHLTIQETLDSLENQNFRKFEVMLIEDKNSEPISPSILHKQYLFKFYYFKNIDKAGAASNRNLGIEKSVGKYLQFLDADDLISDNKLESQVKLIGGFDDTLAICKWGIFEQSILEYTENNSILYKNWRTEDYLAQLNGEFNMLTPLHSYLIPKDLIPLSGLWDENISLGDDGEFMNRVIAHCNRLLFANEAIVYYRRGNNNSLSHQTGLKSAESNYNCAKSYENLISSKFPNHPNLWRSVIRKYNLFFYWSYQRFPDLAKKAEMDIKRLGGKINMTIGSKISKFGQRMLGVKLYLKLRHYIFSA